MAPSNDSGSQSNIVEIARWMKRWLDPATPENAASHAYDRLIEKHIEPRIARIVWRQIGANPVGFRSATADYEIARACHVNAVRGICRQMQQWREGTSKPPENLCAYVDKLAAKSCISGYNSGSGAHVAYLLEHVEQLGLWLNEHSGLIGGFAAWRDEGRQEVSWQTTEDLCENPGRFAQAGIRLNFPSRSLSSLNRRDRLIALLHGVGGPVELNALSRAFAALVGTPTLQIDRPGILVDSEGDTNVPAIVFGKLETHEMLRDLWSGIVELPSEQRAVMILTLSREVRHGIVAEQIVKWEDLCRAAGTSSETLASLWNRPPLSDADIGTLLPLTLMQIRSRRQTAYRRLGRRIQVLDRGALRRLWEAVLTLTTPRPAVYMLHASDPSGASLLMLLSRENIATQRDIAVGLVLTEDEIKQKWNDLPLKLNRIAGMLRKTPQEISRLYSEAETQLKDCLDSSKP